MPNEQGLIHIYTGNGKGKTTAALGLCLRAVGDGRKVLIARFLKSNQSSELHALEMLPGVTLIDNPKSFGFSKVWMKSEEIKAEATAYYNAMLERTLQEAMTGAYDVLMMDEIMAAVRLGVADRETLLGFLKDKPEPLEVIMTGRNAPEELTELADYVSEIQKIKHPFDRGIRARKGIEY